MIQNPNTAEPEQPRRRWFQFRLRPLLIGVAVLAIPCGYVSHEANIVSRRRAWMRSHLDVAMLLLTNPASVSGGGLWDRPEPSENLSLIRRWMGDSPCNLVIVLHGASRADLEEGRSLFPGATFENLR